MLEKTQEYGRTKGRADILGSLEGSGGSVEDAYGR